MNPYKTAFTPDFRLPISMKMRLYKIETAECSTLTLRRRRLRFLGNILRIEPDRLVRRIILALTKGGTDYPKGSLFMDVENSTLEELVRLAQDRYSWNLIVGNL